MMDKTWFGELFLICILQTKLSGGFRVVGPNVSPVVLTGGDALLECRTEPPVSLTNLEVRWFKDSFTSPVHLYTRGQDQPMEQDAAYRGRTELFKEAFNVGNASLKLRNINPFDDGEYKCFIDFKTIYEEAKIHLKVGGMGHQPLIHMEAISQWGIRLTCTSNGWYPRPNVHWINGKGEIISAQSLTIEKDRLSGLFNVLSRVDVRSDSVNRFSCLMQNPLLNKGEEADLQVAALFFPKTNIWMVLFLCMLISLIIASVVEVLHHWRKREKTKELKLFCTLEGYDDTKINDASVTLDKETANPKLELKDENSMRLTDDHHQRSDPMKYFTDMECVLGSNKFTSGQHYWAVDVGMNQKWSLGAALKSVEKRGKIEIVPQHGFWSISCAEGQLYANDNQPTQISVQAIPKKLGVYLSYKSGRIAFYDVASKSLLYAFTGNNFQEELYPFFGTEEVNQWMNVFHGQSLKLHRNLATQRCWFYNMFVKKHKDHTEEQELRLLNH
ncbi:butyrophilin subfamily 1 member A1-like isoform X2 [Narcine bancroftii]